MFDKLFEIFTKFLDMIIKPLKTDRNTFLTYVLTLATIYVVVDRVFEMLLMIITGISADYWGPIKYTIAAAMPVFAFQFWFSSSFMKGKLKKLTFVYIYVWIFYIIIVSAVMQWLNGTLWILFLSIPNLKSIVEQVPEVIKPAFSSIAVYIPLMSFWPIVMFIIRNLNDTKLIMDSMKEYKGFDLSEDKAAVGPYTCEIAFCVDKDTGKTVKTPEVKRYEGTLIVGVTGTGKTATLIEPMVARDMEKKYFFNEVAKEMGFNALKNKIATLNRPYDNEYINNNFNLNMLIPVPEKEAVYKAYFKKMIYYISPSTGEITYKNVGVTAIAADYESTSRLIDVAKNFNLPVNIIDPMNPNSLGMNPFALGTAAQTSALVASVLKAMYTSDGRVTAEEIMIGAAATHAIENVTLLLKIMYPRLNEGKLANLEDLLKYLSDFNLVQDMCDKLQEDSALKEEYAVLLTYFKKNFFASDEIRIDVERHVYFAITQLDNLLRHPGVKTILCNRVNNINFERVLSEGEINLVCTRRGDLGPVLHAAVGGFFLLLLQDAVLRRSGIENSRIPYFLYIDDFADYANKTNLPIFTMFRKYRCGVIVATQTMSQLGDSKSNLRDVILSNSKTKMVFGDGVPEDNKFWEAEFSNKREYKFGRDYTPSDMKLSYSDKFAGIDHAWKPNFEWGKIQSQKFKYMTYKTKDLRGKRVVGVGLTDFLDKKYKQKHEAKMFDFVKFNNTPASVDNEEDVKKNREKFNVKNADFENDPVKLNTTDATVFFDNEDAISINLKKRK